MFFLKKVILFFIIQVWASNFIPNEPQIKDVHQKQYYAEHKVPLLVEYAKMEAEKKVGFYCTYPNIHMLGY